MCMNVCCVHPNEQRHFTKICRINIGTVCRSLNVMEYGGTAKRHATSIIIAKYCALILESLHSHTLSPISLWFGSCTNGFRGKRATLVEYRVQHAVHMFGTFTASQMTIAARKSKSKRVCVCDIDQFYVKLQSPFKQIALRPECKRMYTIA